MVFPRIIPTHSAERVLTETLLEGASLGQFALSASKEQRNRAGRSIWDYFNEAAIGHGLFNTDPHPDNFLFPSGRVVFLDFGRVKRFSEGYLPQWKRLMRTTIERDLPKFTEALIAIGSAPKPARINFDYAHKALLTFYRPWLQDEPFTFTPEYLRRMWHVFGPLNPNTGWINFTADMLFLNQFYFGVVAVLARLGATVDCRTPMMKLLYGPSETVPPPFTADELRQLATM